MIKLASHLAKVSLISGRSAVPLDSTIEFVTLYHYCCYLRRANRSISLHLTQEIAKSS